MSILEIRLLPALAIARLGSSPEPLVNYDLVVDFEDPGGFRHIVPAETFVVDSKTGAISASARPKAVRFKDADGHVHPVAPFFELWARTSEDVLEPVTIDLLAAEGLAPRDVAWSVRVANIKAYRRTRDPADQVHAEAGPFGDHDVHALDGRCDNFKRGASLPFGSVRYIRPTEQFPGIRLRLTPAKGLVYGPKTESSYVVDVYDSDKGTWDGYEEKPEDDKTIPGQIFAGDDVGDRWVGRGYLDDECDGLIDVEIARKGPPLRAFARVVVGPPAFAPDSLPVRTIADEFEQALLGPYVDPSQVSSRDVEEIVRRAIDSVRLMNTAVMNGNVVDGRVDIASTMVRQDTADTGRRFEPIMSPSIVDTLSVVRLHQSILTALRGGTPPWFAEALRRYDEIGDLTDVGRRKMPALMRGADGRHMALTRRLRDIVVQMARRVPGAGSQPDAEGRHA